MTPDPERDAVAATLSRLGAATLAESGGIALAPRVRAVRQGMRVCGPAYPVTCSAGDNLALHVAVAGAPAGSVLAVNVGDLPLRGYWGEVLTVAAVSQGLNGLVIDGCVRDTDTFERHSFAVFATGTALTGTSKDRGGSVGGPTPVGGVVVRAGDWLVGDSDGVALVRSADLETVLAAAEARERKEARFLAALQEGATTLELLSLSPEAVKVGGDG